MKHKMKIAYLLLEAINDCVMKYILAFCAAFFMFSLSSMASNDPEHSKDPDKPKKQSEYSFSLSDTWFSLFNLFQVEKQAPDSLYIADEPEIERIINTPQ